MADVINMSKKQKIDMTKEDGTPIKKIFFGANWEKNRYAGEADVDFDIGSLITNDDRKVVFSRDVVNYKTYGDGSNYPWIEFSGDDTDGSGTKGIDFNGKHYNEYFIIHADKFPQDRSEVTLYLTIFRAIERLQNFGMMDNAKVTICDYENPNGKVWTYNLAENENFEKLNAVEMGRLYRYKDGFRFQALGSGYTGGMTELFKNFGLAINEGSDAEEKIGKGM